MTKDRLLEVARTRRIFVHRFKWSHDKLRKLTRRLCKDGRLRLILTTHDGFLYEACGEQGN